MKLNINVDRVQSPPIAEAVSWLDRPRADPSLPVIDLAQAVPNYPPSPDLMAHVADYVKTAKSAFYTPILGLADLRSALAKDMSATYGVTIEAKNVAITAGANHAYCLATLAVAGPGDEVLLGAPYYFNHDMWFTMQGIRQVKLPCHRTPQGLLPDVAEAARLITERTRAIALVTPNNPTGTIFPPELLAQFLALAKANDIALILDETYRDFLPAGARPHELFNRPGWHDHLVHIYSFSKAFSLTGYRVGALAGGDQLMAAVEKIADTMTICPPNVGQAAALFAVENLQDWKRQKCDAMADKAAALDAAFARHKPRLELISRGAFFAYLRDPAQPADDVALAQKLVHDLAVLLLPGSFFGSPGDAGYLRAAFANIDAGEIDTMVARLATL